MIAFLGTLDSTPEEDDFCLDRAAKSDTSMWFNMALTEPLPKFILGDFLTCLFANNGDQNRQSLCNELSLLILRALSFRGLDFNIRGTGDLHVTFEKQIIEGYIIDNVDDQFCSIRKAIREDYQLKWHISSFVGQMQGECLTQQSGTWEGLCSRFKTIISAALELAEAFGCAGWGIDRSRLLDLCVARFVTESLLNLRTECLEHRRFYIPSQIAQKYGLSFRLLTQVIWIEEQTRNELKCGSCLPSIGYRVVGGKCNQAVKELAENANKLLEKPIILGANDHAIYDLLIQTHYNLKLITKARFDMIGDIPPLSWFSEFLLKIKLKWASNVQWISKSSSS